MMMNQRILSGIGLAGMILVVGLYSAPQSRVQDSEQTRLISSIEGPQLYQAYCAVCHGKDGKGEGPMAKGLKSKPTDLTQIAARSGGVFPMKPVQAIISGETEISGSHGTRQMPVWGPIFSQIAWDEDLGKLRIYNLAAYLSGLQAK